MEDKTKRLGIHEIHDGVFFCKAQETFLHCQHEAQRLGKKTTLKITVDILPPDVNNNEKYGGLKYKTASSIPAEESHLIMTELRKGEIINTGESIDDILQEELEFPNEPKIKQINGGN